MSLSGKYFKFDGAVRLGDRNGVLIPDEVATSSKYETSDAVQLVPASAYSAPIWLRDSEIEAARSYSGGQPVYGFWQSALHNNAVDLHRPLHIAYTGPDHGLFLVCSEGKAVSSGRFAAGFIHDVSEPLEDAHALSPEAVSYWRAPSVQAHTLDELTQQRARRRRAGVLGLAGIASGILVATIVLNVTLASITASRQQSISSSTSARAADEMKLDRLKSLTNNHRFPDRKSLLLLDRITGLFYSSNQVIAEINKQDLAAPEVLVITALPFRNPGFPLKLAMRQDALYDVAIPIDSKGTGPQ